MGYTIAQKIIKAHLVSGEMTPGALANRVLTLPYFYRITPEDYRCLLRHLLETDHLQRTETGGLIVGLAGERQINSFKFYAVFQDREEYPVRSESQELGTVCLPPPAGEKIAIAGKVWLVEEVDHKRHLVYCTEVRGKVPAYFGECPGDINTKILERMQKVLWEDKSYPYLMKNAVSRLALARHTAQNAGVGKEPLIHMGGDMWCLFPWLGTYAFLAMERFLKIRCGDALGLRPLLTEEAAKPLDPMELVYPGEVPVFEKYDEFLPEELVRKGFAYGILDIDTMRKRVLEFCKQANND